MKRAADRGGGSMFATLRPMLAALFGTAAMLAAANAHAAGGAFVVDDAAVDEPGACKVESSVSLANNSALIGMVTPACVVRLLQPTEIGVNIVRTRSNDGEWGTSILPKAKINILPAETGKFGLAVASGSAFNVLTGEYTGSVVNVPVTYTFSDSFKVNLNAGWVYERAQNQHSLSAGAGIEWIPFKPITLIAEVFAFITDRPDVRTANEPRFQAGIRITPIDTMDFDVIYGRNITGENANWVTLGLNVRFPPPKP
jgi:hypothetical protein